MTESEDQAHPLAQRAASTIPADTGDNLTTAVAGNPADGSATSADGDDPVTADLAVTAPEAAPAPDFPFPVIADDVVMARDRHRLQQLRQGRLPGKRRRAPASTQAEQPASAESLQARHGELLARSHTQVMARASRRPAVRLNPDLPVSQAAEPLIAAIRQHQVVIVAGETGSGKTTQLPKLALLAGRGVTGLIGHTQPRRLAARSVSQRIAEELGESLGQSVAFKVRFNESGSQDSLVKVMTDGILLAELSSDRYLSQYDTLIIDEAHERSLNIDFLLGYIRQILPKRPDLKVIVTSATLDVERFSAYFNDAPIFEVEGRSHPVEVRYRPLTDLPADHYIGGSDDDAFDDLEDLLPRAVIDAVEECYADADNKGHPQHADILIFASTEQEIRDLQEALTRFGPRHTEILPLYARLALSEQQRIFNPSGRGRRIIIATNVAETALTVPNIRYVIDPGFARISRYSYRSRVQRLPIEAISQAAANQRKGRCGRIAPGVCIRLYAEADFLGRPEFTEPEIRRTHLASVMLQMENLGLGSLHQFDFLDPPDYRLINDAQKLLIELGALTPDGDGLTPTGRQMARMPIDPRLSRMLLGGAQFGALQEALIIVSALSVQDVRERPHDKQAQADQKHALFREKDSDFLFYLKLWAQLQDNQQQLTENGRRNFARKHYLSWLRIREWQKTWRQLAEMSEQLRLSRNDQPASYENLHRGLLTGLLSFVAHKTEEKNEYLAVRQQKARVFPGSSLYKSGADWIMAFELVETSQVYLRQVAKIEPDWVLSAARSLVKHHYFEPHWSKKSGHVHAYDQVSLYGLIIYHKLPVKYDTINPAEAHEIFLRDAVTLNNLGINAPFLNHNQQLLENLARIEDKLRRRDILLDEQALYEFYAERVPAHIASRKAFEDWRAEAETTQPRLLFVQESDVARDALPDTRDFPDQWQLGHLKLPVRYTFDPGHDRDGVTLRVPLAALPQVDSARLSFGVPGWRLALIEALLKSLPKDKRRPLVPIPDTARRLLPQIDAERGQDISSQLSQRLGQYGISPRDFDWAQIPDFLKPRVEVLDERKKVLEQGRDVPLLQARLRHDAPRTRQDSEGILTEFPADFEFERDIIAAGLPVRQYQALIPVLNQPEADAASQPHQQDMSGKSGAGQTGHRSQKAANAETVAEQLPDGVVVGQFSDLEQASSQHRHGVIALYQRRLGDKLRQIRRLIPKDMVLTYAPLGNRAQLEGLMAYAVLDVWLGTRLPLTAADFDHIWQTDQQQILPVATQVVTDIQAIYELWQSVRRSLLLLAPDLFESAIADMEDQLDALHLDDFVFRIDPQHWQQYPRYLKALKQRLERLPHNLTKDEEAVKQLQPLWQRWQQVPPATAQKWGQRLADYRWALEELRINLFAQPMKTRYPISAKRLEQQWQALLDS